MSEEEPFTHDFIDVRYVKNLWHILQRVGYLGKALDRVGMPPDDSPYLGVLRDTKDLIAEIEDLVKAGAFRHLTEFPD
jgi:hypothetical protein